MTPQMQTPTLAGAGVLGNQAALESNPSSNSIARGAISQDTARSYVDALEPIISRVRRDISAVKLSDGSRWTTEPLNFRNLVQHVSGEGLARGACPINAGETTTRLALLDLDSHKGETPWPEMARHALALSDQLELMLSWKCIPWRSSGGRGIHLYIIWDEPQDAYSVRMALIEAIEGLGYRNKAGGGGVAQGHVEVFPKQNAVGEGEKGNQFILPLAGASVPLDPAMQPLPPEMVEWLEWPVSEPVTYREAPVREQAASDEGLEPIEKVKSALAAISNVPGDAPDYDAWRDFAFSVHEATGGSEEGREAFIEWSAQNPVFDEAFFNDRVWAYIKSADARRGGGITRGTLFGKARAAGWTPGAAASPDGFEDVAGAAPWEADAPACLVNELGMPVATSQSADPYGLAGCSPAFIRKSDGAIRATIGNLLLALGRSNVCGWHIRYDEFTDDVMLAEHGTEHWRQFGDVDYTWLRDYLEKNGFEPIGKENLRDVVQAIARKMSFDSAQLWLGNQVWDGVPRVETFLTAYLQVQDAPYTRAVSRYLWTAMAGRINDPGCQADMVPVLVGAQGTRKTSTVRSLVPSPDFFMSMSLDDDDPDNLARRMRGKAVCEIAELTVPKREVERVKDFLTRTQEEWVPKFREFSTKFPRRVVFIGTTNKEQFLADETGNRRWLPVKVGMADIDALRRDLLQLWAEAAKLHRQNGVEWEAAERLAGEVHGEFQVEDAWAEKVQHWLESADFNGEKVRERGRISVREFLTDCMRFDDKQISNADQQRMGRVLRAMGLPRTQARRDGKPTWVYVTNDTTCHQQQI